MCLGLLTICIVCTPLTSAHERDGNAALVQRLLYLGHIDRTIVFGPRLGSDGINRNDSVGEIGIRGTLRNERYRNADRIDLPLVPANSAWSSRNPKWMRRDIASWRPNGPVGSIQQSKAHIHIDLFAIPPGAIGGASIPLIYCIRVTGADCMVG